MYVIQSVTMPLSDQAYVGQCVMYGFISPCKVELQDEQCFKLVLKIGLKALKYI